ncbi:M48 family metallopeptidase [Thalassolituus sp.]|uniref:M48 family metallopeptidase n=1 Tax=Thalassolituus sp. TaxID=2030822 RepID=UPI0035145ABE
MNFFRHQEEARRNTSKLIILFSLAVIAVILTVNLLFIGVIYFATFNESYGSPVWSIYDLEHWAVVSGTTLAVILICSFFRQLSLSKGSDVANSLGATLLDPGSRDPDERRLLNVVEEMAIASGMPVPDVYVMEDSGINAFAAGYQPSDAVIGITRGAMEALNRDQLQGVIAHEFSHIFNGDMRMNMRLTGIIYGIVFIGEIGRMMTRASYNRHSRRGGDPRAAILGLALMAVGYGGEFFGRLIKSAVSRQREFLADASAVQFTRNPDGISGALKVIGYGAGTRVGAPAALEVSHFFFGPVMRFRRTLFATHPPLDERIQKIEPGWDGHYLKPRQEHVEIRPFSYRESDAISGFQSSNSVTTQDAMAIMDDIPYGARGEELLRNELAVINAMSAEALVFALLMSGSSESIARQQQELIHQNHGAETFRESLRYLNEVRRTDKEIRLELVERAMPALRRMSLKQYRTLNQTLVKLIQLDGKIDLYEWCLYRLILQYLGRHFGTLPAFRQKHTSAHALADDIAVVVSYVAHAGTHDDQAAGLAFEAALLSQNLLMRPRNPEHSPRRSLKPLNKALSALISSAPEVRERLMLALSVCVRHDNQITLEERDMITTLGAILETPAGMFEELMPRAAP